MNLIPTLSIYRKTFFSGLIIILLALPLSGCLKVTGPAKDSFDLENEEPKLNLSSLIFNTKNTDTLEQRKTKTAQLERTVHVGDTNLSTSTDILPDDTDDNMSSKTVNRTPDLQSELPEQDFSTLSPQDIADFDLWKRARKENSSQYQEFREYREFKEYQEWLRLQEASDSD